MPTTRKRIARGRTIGAGGFSEDAYQYYASGPFFCAEDFGKGKTEKDLKVFWNQHKGAIMDRYLREIMAKGWVGMRPWAFWDDMPEPQRKVPPGDFDSQQVWDHQTKQHDWVEDDIAYLRRLNLLEDWEVEFENTIGGVSRTSTGCGQKDILPCSGPTGCRP